MALSCAATMPARAQDGTSDPKEWCGEFTSLVASADENAIGRMISSGARGHINPENALVSLSQMIAIVRSDKVKSISFLAEKNYEGAFARVWYMMVIGNKGTFFRCTFIKDEAIWQLTDFDFNTDSDALALP